jgi:hypothetical protein
VIASIEDPAVIERILDHLGRERIGSSKHLGELSAVRDRNCRGVLPGSARSIRHWRRRRKRSRRGGMGRADVFG